MSKLTDDEVKLLAFATAIKANTGDDLNQVAKQVLNSYVKAIEIIKSLPSLSEPLPWFGVMSSIDKR